MLEQTQACSQPVMPATFRLPLPAAGVRLQSEVDTAKSGGRQRGAATPTGSSVHQVAAEKIQKMLCRPPPCPITPFGHHCREEMTGVLCTSGGITRSPGWAIDEKEDPFSGTLAQCVDSRCGGRWRFDETILAGRPGRRGSPRMSSIHRLPCAAGGRDGFTPTAPVQPGIDVAGFLFLAVTTLSPGCHGKPAATMPRPAGCS